MQWQLPHLTNGQTIKALLDTLRNISPQCSRMSRNTMRGKPALDLLHIPRSHSAYFDRVQNHGIAYQWTLETAHQSIGLKSELKR